MKIKQIPFPKVEEVLCVGLNTSPLVCELGDYGWGVYVDQDGHKLTFYISFFYHDMWEADGMKTCVRDDADPEDYNSVLRGWYKMACKEWQEWFEEDIKRKYLEGD